MNRGMSAFVRLLFVGISILEFTACTPAGSRLPPTLQSPIAPSEVTHRQLPEVGALAVALARLRNIPYADTWYCDLSLKGIQDEIVTELDRRADWFREQEQIRANAGLAAEDWTGYEKEMWRPDFPFYRRVTPKVHQEDRWQLGGTGREHSWISIHRKFIDARDTDQYETWAYVLRRVRATLDDDFDRIIDGKNFFLDHHAKMNLPALTEAYQNCILDSSCTLPVLQPEIATWAQSVVPYESNLSTLNSMSSHPESARTELAQFFFTRLMMDTSQFVLPRLFYVARVSPTRWVVSLSSEGVESLTDSITRTIEEAWHSETYEVKVEWKSGTDAQSLPRFVLREEFGGRAFVSFDGEAPLIHLFPNTSSDTLQHEFGHILGLPDEYYTQYSGTTCQYRTDFNPSNLMSDTYLGTVLPSHWEDLNRRYPYVGPVINEALRSLLLDPVSPTNPTP